MSSSSDEGEIRENGVEDPIASKASTLRQSKPDGNGNGVDRQDRRARTGPTRSPDRGDYRSRRLPSPRGNKRSRDDDRDSYNRGARGGPDPRRFRVHYEDAPPPSRGRYEDLDRPSGHRRHDSRDYLATNSRFDDGDRDRDRDHDYGRADKRPRTRSPSPYRSGRGDGRGRYDRGRRDAEGPSRPQPGQQAASIKYSAQTAKQVRGDAAARRPPAAENNGVSKDVAKSDQGATDERMAKDTSHLHLRYEDFDFHPQKGLTANNHFEKRLSRRPQGVKRRARRLLGDTKTSRRRCRNRTAKTSQGGTPKKVSRLDPFACSGFPG